MYPGVGAGPAPTERIQQVAADREFETVSTQTRTPPKGVVGEAVYTI